MTTPKVLLLAMVGMLLAVPMAKAQDLKPTEPAMGLWCTGSGTFVIRNGVLKYFRKGALVHQATYKVSGNKIVTSGKTYAFFRNTAGSKIYRRDGHDEMIAVQRTCRYPDLS
jgi:hypothetical protein